MQSILTLGTIVREQYAIEEVLDNRGSGTVYLVRDQHDQGRSFVLKEIPNSKKKERHRYIFESTRFLKLAHPALPLIHHVFKDEQGRVYILMEYIEGTNLEEVRLGQSDQRFPLSRLITLLSSVVEAVSYLHSQQPAIIHGNIKPSNIIVPKAENPAVLVGFGHEKEYDEEETATIIRRAASYSSYEAPEQLIGATNPRTDIYALGATLYTVLTGIVPPASLYRRTELGDKQPDPLLPANRLIPAIPMPISEAIHRAMSIYSDDRFSTVEQFWEVLRQSTDTITIERQASEYIVAASAEENTALAAYSSGQNIILPPVVEDKALAFHADIMVEHRREPVVDMEKIPALPIIVPEIAKLASTFSDLSLRTPAFSEEVKTPVTASPHGLAQVYSPKKYRMPFLTFFAVIVTLLASLGVGASLWNYITAHHLPISAIPTSTLQTVQTPSLTTASPNTTVISTSVPTSLYPNIAGLYYGTIVDITTAVSTEMSLTKIQQIQITISGNFTGLNRTGTFNGTIDRSKHIKFTVKDSAGYLIFSFDGNIQSGGGISGNYCSVNQKAQCKGGYGLWSVALSH